MPDADARRRAGGRRHYNHWRQVKAELRRVQVAELLPVYGLSRGAQTRIAQRLGVHRSTICRDVHAVIATGWRGVLLPYYLKGWTVTELAHAYGLPRSVVRFVLDRDLARRCFELRYGREGKPAMSYDEIAVELWLSVPEARRYVRQGEADALEEWARRRGEERAEDAEQKAGALA